jgi:hypothetical protein
LTADAVEQQVALAVRRKQADDAATAAQIENANRLGMTLAEYQENLRRTERAQEDHTRKMRAEFEKPAIHTTNLFEQVSRAQRVSIGDAIHNLEVNARNYSSWLNKLDFLTNMGFHEGIVKQLREAGVASIETVEGFMFATELQVSSMNRAFENSMWQASLAVIQTAEDGGKSMSEAGQTMAGNIADGFETGIAQAKPEINKFANDMKFELGGAVSSARFNEIGTMMVRGIQNGLREGRSALFDDIRKLAEDAARTARDALGIRSPSRVFAEIGRNIGEGLAGGINGMRGHVGRSVEGLFKGVDAHFNNFRNVSAAENAGKTAKPLYNGQSGGKTYIIQKGAFCISAESIDTIQKLESLFDGLPNGMLAAAGT